MPVNDSNIKRIAHLKTNCVYLFWFWCMIKCTHLDAVNPKLTSTTVYTTILHMTSLFRDSVVLLGDFKFISKNTWNHCKCSFWMHFWNEMSDIFFEKYYFWTHYLQSYQNCIVMSHIHVQRFKNAVRHPYFWVGCWCILLLWYLA